MAGLVYVSQNNESEMVLCGGTLISNNVIITAAHCNNTDGVHYLQKVRLGHANLNSEVNIDVDIEEIIVHPDFGLGPYGHFNDLALIKLRENVNFSNRIYPICLPKEEYPEETLKNKKLSILKVAGWGKYNETALRTDKLLKLELNYVNSEDCENEFIDKVPGFILRDTQICARGPENKDSCNGDSGGPLMRLDLSNGKFELIGITSFGTRACDSLTPGVYTKISKYLDFIRKYITESADSTDYIDTGTNSIDFA